MALNANLTLPSNIAMDPGGLIYFLDGNAPGQILCINDAGFVEVIARVRQSPSVNSPPIDGRLETATAYSFTGLSFVDGGKKLLVADTFTSSIVHRHVLAKAPSCSRFPTTEL